MPAGACTHAALKPDVCQTLVGDNLQKDQLSNFARPMKCFSLRYYQTSWSSCQSGQVVGFYACLFGCCFAFSFIYLFIYFWEMLWPMRRAMWGRISYGMNFLCGLQRLVKLIALDSWLPLGLHGMWCFNSITFLWILLGHDYLEENHC